MARTWDSRTRRHAVTGCCLALGWILTSLLIVYFVPRPFEAANLKFYDFKLTSRTPAPIDDKVVHLDVDDRAIRKFDAKYGPWPWNRAATALITNRLAELGAKVLVMDLLFTGKGRNEAGDEALFKSIKQTGNVVPAFAARLSRGRVRNVETPDASARTDALYDKAWPIKVGSSFKPLFISQIRRNFVPMAPIIRGACQMGHINSTPEQDGVHRRIPLLIRFGDRYLPSLSLAALAAYWDLKPSAFDLSREGFIVIRGPDGESAIPVDRRFFMHMSWRSPKEGAKAYSVADLLEDDLPSELKERFENKIVILGVAWTGATDFGTNPYAGEIPLSRLHSAALNTMLSGEFIRAVPAFPIPMILAAVFSLVVPVLGASFRFRTTVLVGIVGILAIPALSMVLFLYRSVELPVAEILMLTAPSALLFLAYKGLVTEILEARESRALERYISPEILRRIAIGEADIDVRAKRKELTILFVDMVGFSTISETLDVEYLADFLNEFLEKMTAAVFHYEGTVDKFLGDGLLAFFGEPLHLDNHALAAVRTADLMQESVVDLNRKWASSGIRELQDEMRIRVGINTGVVMVGNIGSDRRLEYTVVGSAVNIASRIQEKAPPDGILISARTHGVLQGTVKCSPPATVRVKGVARELTVYEVERPVQPVGADGVPEPGRRGDKS